MSSRTYVIESSRGDHDDDAVDRSDEILPESERIPAQDRTEMRKSFSRVVWPEPRPGVLRDLMVGSLPGSSESEV